MSRIGRSPIKVPAGVDVNITESTISIKGPKGILSQDRTREVTIEYNAPEKVLQIMPTSESKKARSQWGLYKVLIDNMMTGVTKGFQKVLIIEGIGYKAEMKGKNLLVFAGYSHPIMFISPDGITLGIDGPTKMIVSGINKQVVGQVAAEIRKIRPPEPFKGKGIRYLDERIIRKAGKTGVK